MSSMTSWTSSNSISNFLAAPPPTSASKISAVARLHDKMEDVVTSGNHGNQGKHRPETETTNQLDGTGRVASKNRKETFGSSSTFPVAKSETELRHSKRFSDENLVMSRISAINESNVEIQDISNDDPIIRERISVFPDTSALPPTTVHHPDDIRASSHLRLVRHRGSADTEQLEHHRNIGFSVADILDPAKFSGNNYPERGTTGSRRLAEVLGHEVPVPGNPESPPSPGVLQSVWSPWLERLDLHVRNRLKLNKLINGYFSGIISLLCKNAY